jgi:hypothetical protein
MPNASGARWLRCDVRRSVMASLRKYHFGLIVGLAAACAVVAAWAWNRHPSDIRWVERVSGVAIPKGITGLRIERPTEFCIAGKMMLPRSEVDSFLKANGFKPRTEYSLNAALGVSRTVFTNPASLRLWCGVEGRSQTEHWEFACDPTEGALLFVLLFPDMHGDPPP